MFKNRYFIIVLVISIVSVCYVVFIGIFKEENFLTDQEKLWLKENCDNIKLLMEDVPPYLIYKEDGEHEGIFIDYYNEIEKLIGVKFDFHYIKNWYDILKYAQENDDYIIVGIGRRKEREHYLTFTNSFIKAPYVILTRKGSNIKSIKDLKDKNIGTVEGYAVNHFLEENYSHLNYTYLKNNLEGILKVSYGDLDAMMLNQLLGLYYIEEQAIINLSIAGELGYVNPLSVGVSNKNQMLFRIMDKTVDKIGIKKQKEIFEKWVNISSGKIPQKTIRLIFILLFALLAVFSLAFIWVKSLQSQVSKKTNEIKESENKYRSLIANSNDAIFIRYENKFVVSNKKFEELFGYSNREISSPDFNTSNLIASEEQDEITKINALFEYTPNAPTRFEFTGVTKENERLSIEASVNNVPYKEGYATQAILRDMTERKNREIELSKAKKKAEESDRLKSAFLANMSHEIRTPMNGILGFTEILTSEDISKDKRDYYANIVKSSSQQLLNIISDILDVSKIEAEEFSLIDTNFDLPEFVDEMMQQTRILLNQKSKPHINLLHSIKVSTKIINADRNRLAQIVLNLLSNAVKFTEKGTIELACEQIDKEMFSFSVKDTGIGIDKSMHQPIFERFRRVDENSFEGGTGLGLAICKVLVKKMGGKINVKSELGKGSEFYFTVKAKEGEAIQPKVKKKVTKTTNKERLKILIAEDEENNYLYLSEILNNRKRYEVFHAHDGVLAVQLFKEKVPDIVLMDIKMPHLDGYGALKKIKKIDNAVPVIATTAFAMSSDEKKILNAGFNAYLPKPIGKEKFLSILNEFS